MQGVTTALARSRIDIIERAPLGSPVLQPFSFWSGRTHLRTPQSAALV
jgi:hypothetical protein